MNHTNKPIVLKLKKLLFKFFSLIYNENNHMSAEQPIIKTVLNFLLSNHMLESKLVYTIIGNDVNTYTANNSNETSVLLEEQSTDRDDIAATSASTCSNNIDDLDDNFRQTNNNRHVAVITRRFVCDVCNRPCLSAAGLMNSFQYIIVVVFIWLQLLACFAVRHPAKSNEPKVAAQRRSGSGYVDFGAHTGPLGSYGWYADFPANRN
ncbi:uncharacterized protein LOC114128223 isoform X2 [Aphis gossypii]|uniref:uncharacterized protein LOC114128223 isoform X2 n=1 Tax=Aphis gossypii TaxID=80765 RepID=UPI002158E07C|nr:uncharacterized protein LOC114128223 isoform X2 [Aphis gossypii]